MTHWEGEDEAKLELEAELKKRGIEIPADAYEHCGMDFYLRRFLRARQLDIDKAIVMVQANIAWRAENDCKTILNRPLPGNKAAVMSANFLSFWAGYDKKGNSVYLEHTAAIPFDALAEHMTVEELIHAHVQLQEYQMKVIYEQTSRKQGKRCFRTTNVMDLRGLGLSSFTSFIKDLILRVSAVNQENYPEALEECYIVNAPWAFTAIYAFIKPFLNENTLKKIKVLGYGEAMWKELSAGIGPGFDLPEEWLCSEEPPVPGGNKCRKTCHQLAQDHVAMLTKERESKA